MTPDINPIYVGIDRSCHIDHILTSDSSYFLNENCLTLQKRVSDAFLSSRSIYHISKCDLQTFIWKRNSVKTKIDLPVERKSVPASQLSTAEF